ncbi:MAG: sigma factor-like helix-turn-helix DNA-binding protein [Thermoproteus sp.]
MKLTATEQRVVELYNNGLKPREIANKLGISINTVYKALSKHRRIAELSEEIREGPPHQDSSYYAVVLPIWNTPVVYNFAIPNAAQFEELSRLVKRLEDILERLEKLADGRQAEHKVAIEEPRTAPPPDFIKQNAWVRLLRGKSNGL